MIAFPNHSRSYDVTRHDVRFWGYDSAIEASFFIDEDALVETLRAGRIHRAALDVFDTEPLPAGSRLADCPHLILTPHIAGVTRESNARVSMMIAEKVTAALEAAGANP